MLKDSDKKLNRLTMKNVLFLITFTIVLIWVILHLNEVIAAFFTIVGLCKPFIYGIMIAYVFNLPLKYFLRKLPESLGKGKKILAALLSIIVILVVIAFIFWIVVPQVIENITVLAQRLPGYIESATQMIENAIKNKDIPDSILKQINAFSEDFGNMITTAIKEGLPHLLTMASGVASSVANVFMAIVIAVYLTVSKNKLLAQCKRFLYAFLSEKKYNYTLKVSTLTNKTFSSFITGQLCEAIIIGVLCYIGCLIFKFPYPSILSVIIGCTNIIPIFGAIFGVGLSALLVAFVNPIQGVFFVIFGICLQQFESNLIYPKVVGSSVGLSGLWVLFAITVGGGLFGFVGMLLGLPTFSVLYSLLREEVNRRVQQKQQPATTQV